MMAGGGYRGTRSLAQSFFFFQAEDGIRDLTVTGVQRCALPILAVAETEVTVVEPAPAEAPPAETADEAAPPAKPARKRRTKAARAEPEAPAGEPRSEERRVGKEGRSRWSPYH